MSDEKSSMSSHRFGSGPKKKRLTFSHFSIMSWTALFALYLIWHQSALEIAPAPPAAEKKAASHPLLEQPFTYLGSGGQCTAFLGADGKTVLKILKTTKSKTLNSFRIASSHFPNESALLFLHLEQTATPLPVLLTDSLGLPHNIDLSTTAFLLQENALPFLPHLENLIHSHQQEKAKQCIHDYIALLASHCRQGINYTDLGLRRNFGLIGSRVILFDLGSFVPDPSITLATQLPLKTAKLLLWLEQKDPTLTAFAKECVQAELK